jgi:beta-lactamase class A
VNQRLDQLGCPQTRLLRRAFSPDTPRSRPFGLGVTTAAEQIDLLTRLVKHQLGGPAVDDTVLAMLAMQQDRAAIPRLLPSGWTYAGKTGSNIGLRADVGLISAPDGRQFVMAVFCSGMPGEDWSVENPGLRAIARLAQALLLA